MHVKNVELILIANDLVSEFSGFDLEAFLGFDLEELKKRRISRYI